MFVFWVIWDRSCLVLLIQVISRWTLLILNKDVVGLGDPGYDVCDVGYFG